MKKSSLFLLSIWPAFLCIPAVHGEFFPLVVSEDSVIEVSQADTNRNASQLLVRRAGDIANARKSYLAFDLTPLEELDLLSNIGFSLTTHNSFMVGTAGPVISEVVPKNWTGG